MVKNSTVSFFFFSVNRTDMSVMYLYCFFVFHGMYTAVLFSLRPVPVVVSVIASCRLLCLSLTIGRRFFPFLFCPCFAYHVKCRKSN